MSKVSEALHLAVRVRYYAKLFGQVKREVRWIVAACREHKWEIAQAHALKLAKLLRVDVSGVSLEALEAEKRAEE